jgi:nitrite reductase (NADH) small subunit
MQSDRERAVGDPRLAPADGAADWRELCPIDDLLPGTGAAALVDGTQVALVRMPDGMTVYAVGNFDPFSKANVIARGIVGDRGGIPKIASPIFKHTFDLRTGVCFEDPAIALPCWPTRVRRGCIEILWNPRSRVL